MIVAKNSIGIATPNQTPFHGNPPGLTLAANFAARQTDAASEVP